MAARPRPAARAEPRFRLRINVGATVAIGPGKIALVEAIGATGSITAAAKSMGMSYRRAWLLTDELNRALGRPAVRSVIGGPRGGSSELTPVGVELIRRYRTVAATAAEACATDIAAIVRLLR